MKAQEGGRKRRAFSRRKGPIGKVGKRGVFFPCFFSLSLFTRRGCNANDVATDERSNGSDDDTCWVTGEAGEDGEARRRSGRREGAWGRTEGALRGPMPVSTLLVCDRKGGSSLGRPHFQTEGRGGCPSRRDSEETAATGRHRPPFPFSVECCLGRSSWTLAGWSDWTTG